MNSFLQNNEWAQDPSFNHFWMHYDMSQRWLQQHMKATRQLCQENGSTNDDHCQEFQEPEVTERLSRCEIRGEDVEEREEMSEEVKEFFAKTRNHRQELKEKRQAEEKQKNVESKKKGNQEEYVNIEQSELNFWFKKEQAYFQSLFVDE
ncbi:hypothetical protein B9Z55_010366 [Caenorhabditis nigoni]|uniref:Gem-associated protein 8 n=1 Tax=Caenorhabditis nigoni TaxID=1611254 RepID=A0A2G5UFJ7_9PELO|nr:hypothetical protein B9Z55_010366 [Caenorhabditis nigoni]